jgi:uncharacterized repeat protein (TIGR03803 family)
MSSIPFHKLHASVARHFHVTARLVASGGLALAATTHALGADQATDKKPLHRYAVIHRFALGEGWTPDSALVQDKYGNLYGINRNSSQGKWYVGRNRGCGLIFRIAPDGTESTLHDFTDQKALRGCRIGGDLLLDTGALYGTSGGGKYGWGTIWRLSLHGKYQVLHHFIQDEAEGGSALVRGADGALYGTSATGGKNRGPNGETYGTVYRLAQDGQFTVLYNFRETDPMGVRPHHGLTLGADGLLYGTADDGQGSGTVFRVEADGHLTLIHTFHHDEGLWQRGLSLGQDGWLYGASFEGGAYGLGSVWRVASDRRFEMLHSFNGQDGSYPMAPPVQAPDGRWYGTTYGDVTAPYPAKSTLYRAEFDGSQPTVLHVFSVEQNDGKRSWSRLLVGHDGGIYGTTPNTVKADGTGPDTGTVFRQGP